MTDSTTMPDWYEWALQVQPRYKNHPWRKNRLLSDKRERDARNAAWVRDQQIPFVRGAKKVDTHAEKTRDRQSVPGTERHE